MTENNQAPRAFISYSWTTPDHEDWVLEFATHLRESGVNAILDKWHLREGHDGYAFMEQMVTDESIRKVILICDKGYVSKADNRADGVGAEAQIITPELYNREKQDKFVAVVVERDDRGELCLPVFYRGRIHIDFTDESSRVENFDQVLRWVFDQPVHQEPPIGEQPAFLSVERDTITLATSSRFRRAADALRRNRENASVLVEEYFDHLGNEFEKLRVQSTADQEFDELIVKNIESFCPIEMK